MGYIKHYSVIVTSFDDKAITIAHEKAKEIYDRHFLNNPMMKWNGSIIVSNIVGVIVNSGGSFFIAPDQSKEGWDDSDKSDAARKEFLDWMDNKSDCEYIEVFFGGDDARETIRRSSNTFLKDEE